MPPKRQMCEKMGDHAFKTDVPVLAVWEICNPPFLENYLANARMQLIFLFFLTCWSSRGTSSLNNYINWLSISSSFTLLVLRENWKDVAHCVLQKDFLQHPNLLQISIEYNNMVSKQYNERLFVFRIRDLLLF